VRGLIFGLISAQGIRFGDIPKPDTETWEQRERAKEIIKVVKGMQEEGEISLEKKEEPQAGGSPADIIFLLLRMEQRMERIEQKIDAIANSAH